MSEPRNVIQDLQTPCPHADSGTRVCSMCMPYRYQAALDAQREQLVDADADNARLRGLLEGAREALGRAAWNKGKRLEIIENCFCGSWCGKLVLKCDDDSAFKIRMGGDGCAGFYARSYLAAPPPSEPPPECEGCGCPYHLNKCENCGLCDNAGSPPPSEPTGVPCCNRGAKLAEGWVARYKCPDHGWQEGRRAPIVAGEAGTACTFCRGKREVLYFTARPGGPPGNQMMPCPKCNGTSRTPDPSRETAGEGR